MSDGNSKRDIYLVADADGVYPPQNSHPQEDAREQLELFAAQPADGIYAVKHPFDDDDVRIGIHPAMSSTTVAPMRIEIAADMPSAVRDDLLADPLGDSAQTVPIQVPAYRPAVRRTPDFADASLFAVLLVMGFLVTTGMLGVSLHYHWFGLRDFNDAKDDTRIALVTQFMIYLVGLAGAVPLFQMVWGKGFFSGLHWHGATAGRIFKRLLLTAVLCNVVAMVGNYVLPFPQHAPIDKMFSSQADAWMLFCFGVTVAPFFEEMIFRGFLLPAMATAWDWCAEKITHTSPREPDADGNPAWSRGAMVFAALVVSAPFAMMHSAQVGSAWGPISLLYCVSLILCAVRLTTRSLAASTVVHSAYNFMLFAVMLIQTDGFRHLDKM